MSTPSARPSPGPRNPPPLRHRLHRIAGLASVLVLVHLVGTGLPLQFTAELRLAERHVTAPLLLDHYGLQAPDTAVRSADVVQIGEQLFWGERPLGNVGWALRGSVRVGTFLVVLLDRSLLLVPFDRSDLREELPTATAALRIGVRTDRVFLETAGGLFTLDDDWANLVPSTAPLDTIAWSSIVPLEGETLVDYRSRYRSRLLDLERIFQDLHSGRIFGAAGEWIVNVASLLFLGLAATGLLIWWRSRPR